MKIRRTKVSDVVVLQVIGNLKTTEEMDDFKKETFPVFSGSFKKILIDFSELEKITSEGLGSVNALQRLSTERGIELKITGLNEKMKELLRITKLITVFSYYGSLGDALISFKEEKNES